MAFCKSQNHSNKRATSVEAACGCLLTCPQFNCGKDENQPSKASWNDPKDKQPMKKHQFKKSYEIPAKEVRVWHLTQVYSLFPHLSSTRQTLLQSAAARAQGTCAPQLLSTWRKLDFSVSYPSPCNLFLRSSPGWVWSRGGAFFLHPPSTHAREALPWAQQLRILGHSLPLPMSHSGGAPRPLGEETWEGIHLLACLQTFHWCHLCEGVTQAEAWCDGIASSKTLAQRFSLGGGVEKQGVKQLYFSSQRKRLHLWERMKKFKPKSNLKNSGGGHGERQLGEIPCLNEDTA